MNFFTPLDRISYIFVQNLDLERKDQKTKELVRFFHIFDVLFKITFLINQDKLRKSVSDFKFVLLHIRN